MLFFSYDERASIAGSSPSQAASQRSAAALSRSPLAAPVATASAPAVSSGGFVGARRLSFLRPHTGGVSPLLPSSRLCPRLPPPRPAPRPRPRHHRPASIGTGAGDEGASLTLPSDGGGCVRGGGAAEIAGPATWCRAAAAATRRRDRQPHPRLHVLEVGPAAHRADSRRVARMATVSAVIHLRLGLGLGEVDAARRRP